MADVAQISDLIAEAGSLDENVATVLRTAGDSWVVRFETVDVEITTDDERNRMILATTVGLPASERRLSVLESLMMTTVVLLFEEQHRTAVTPKNFPEALEALGTFWMIV